MHVLIRLGAKTRDQIQTTRVLTQSYLCAQLHPYYSFYYPQEKREYAGKKRPERATGIVRRKIAGEESRPVE